MEETNPKLTLDAQPQQTVEPVPETPKPSNAGRPTVMNDQTLNKLRDAFLMGCSDREACFYADISLQTLYNYQKDNPEYLEQKAMWKENPILKARNTVYKSLDQDDMAKWYLERKKRNEFATRQELTGGDKEAAPLKIEYVSPIDTNPTTTDDSVYANVETAPGVAASDGQ